MAYLRAYQAMAGDPGLFKRLKRGIRIGRLKPPRPLRGMLRSPLIGFVPGVGGALSAYGQLMGDPGLWGAVASIGSKIFGSTARSLGSKAGAWMASPIGKTITGGAISGAAGAGIGAILGARHGGPAGMGRSYRRMNVGNIKALRRSMRRVEGFANLAKQTIQFTHSTRMKKRGKRR